LQAVFFIETKFFSKEFLTIARHRPASGGAIKLRNKKGPERAPGL
jgi:hypothetical protein